MEPPLIADIPSFVFVCRHKGLTYLPEKMKMKMPNSENVTKFYKM